MEQIALRSRNPHVLFGRRRSLSQGTEVFAAVAAAVDPDALAGSPGELLDHGGGDRLLTHAFSHSLGAVGVGRPLVQFGDMFAATLGPLLAAVEYRSQHF